MYKRISFILFLIACTTIPLFAQFTMRKSVVPAKPADSIDIKYYAKKKGLNAAIEVASLNVGIWAFDYFALNADYAKISLKTMKKNLRHGFVWDNDQMGTNMFMHPYHGSLYYNSARSNGYNYWESGAFALAGSAMWELFMENEYPSVNDIIATPIGGLALGEIFYRTSDLVLDDRRTGSHRFGRELAGFLIAPTRGLSRIISGDAWRKRTTSGKQFGVPDLSVEISSGIRFLELKNKIFDRGAGIAVDVNIEYGDRFGIENIKPYEYFSFKANVSLQKQQPPLSQLNIIGQLYAGELVDTNKDFVSLGIYQHFDYYDSDTISTVSSEVPYKLGSPASVGVGIIYKNKRWKDYQFDGYFHFNAIMLGASLSDHYKVDNRNYNLGSGFSTKLGLNLSYKNRIGLSILQESYRMFTWKGYPKNTNWDNIDAHNFNYQGDRSEVTFVATTTKLDIKLKKQLYLSGMVTNYIRDTNYKYLENVFSKTTEGKLMLTYKF